MAFVHYRAKNVFTVNAVGCKPVRFLPGVNEVKDSDLECLKKHPIFAEYVRLGTIEILRDPKSQDGKRPIVEMLDLISQTYQPKLLKEIIAKDDRKEVIEAAQAQIEALKPQKKGETGDHFRE